MSTLTIQLPESLKKRIEALAAREGYSVSQFLASAAGEKLAVVLTMEYLRREAGRVVGRILKNTLPQCRTRNRRRTTVSIRSIARDVWVFGGADIPVCLGCRYSGIRLNVSGRRVRRPEAGKNVCPTNWPRPPNEFAVALEKLMGAIFRPRAPRALLILVRRRLRRGGRCRSAGPGRLRTSDRGFRGEGRSRPPQRFSGVCHPPRASRHANR